MSISWKGHCARPSQGVSQPMKSTFGYLFHPLFNSSVVHFWTQIIKEMPPKMSSTKFKILLLSLPSLVILTNSFHSPNGFHQSQLSQFAAKGFYEFSQDSFRTRQYLHSQPTLKFLSFDKNNDGNENLIEKAQKLRQEAQQLESQLQKSQKSKNKNEVFLPPKKIDYCSLENSCWTISYRFAQDPVNSNSSEGDTPQDLTDLQSKFYSGKLNICFQEDGYTNKIVGIDDNLKVSFDKIWGWDEEVSNQDESIYLLFSADISLTDKNKETMQDRFYFQAQVDKDSNGTIRLSDGTVTVKREVERTNNGGKLFWGIFDGSGILAQFRNVGNFSCKPIPCD